MNSAFVGYKELCRSRRVLSAEVDNTPLDLHNSSYPTQPNSLIVNSTGRARGTRVIRDFILSPKSGACNAGHLPFISLPLLDFGWHFKEAGKSAPLATCHLNIKGGDVIDRYVTPCDKSLLLSSSGVRQNRKQRRRRERFRQHAYASEKSIRRLPRGVSKTRGRSLFFFKNTVLGLGLGLTLTLTLTLNNPDLTLNRTLTLTLTLNNPNLNLKQHSLKKRDPNPAFY